MKFFLTLPFLALLLFLSSCSDADIQRLDVLATVAEERVKQAEDARKMAESALAAAHELVAKLGIEAAKPVMEKAEAALAAAHDAIEVGRATATAARSAAEAAKASQAAGGGTIQVIIGALMALVTGGIAAAPVIMKAIETAKALRQTVVGVEAARTAIGEAEWKAKVAPALAAAQDEKVRVKVDTVRANLSKVVEAAPVVADPG